MPNSPVVRAIMESLPLADACVLHSSLRFGQIDESTRKLVRRGLQMAQQTKKS